MTTQKQISKLKISSYILGLILVIQVIGTVFYFRSSNVLHSVSLQKIDSLINEIGDLKNENQFLNQKLNDRAEENQLNEETLQQLYLESSTQQQSQKELQKGLASYQDFLLGERKRLSDQTNDLNNQLNRKDQQINTLEQTKENQKQFQDLNDKLYSVLLLGTNQRLTDSIQLAVVDTDKQKTTLVSIPRDLYYDGRKINEYYEFYGIEKISEIIQKITGVAVDKYVTFNFQSFQDLIDSIGGVDVDVEKKLVDNSYPTNNFGYKTVVFNPGLQKMNGQVALEYARSRHSTSDFDRSKRQQQIIIAIKQKLESFGILKNVEFYVTAFQSLQQNLKTDFNILEALQVFDQYKGYQLYAGNVLSNENFLYSSKSISGQSILLPKNGSFVDFQKKLLEII